jgi:hypothetical protein
LPPRIRISQERKCSTPATIPAALQAAIDVMTALFTGFFALLSGIIFPATVTPVSALASFGILFPLVVIVLGFLYSLVRGRG